MEGVHVAIASEPTSVVPPRADPVNVLQWFLCSCKSIPCYRKKSTVQHDAATVWGPNQWQLHSAAAHCKTGAVKTLVMQARYDTFASLYSALFFNNIAFKSCIAKQAGQGWTLVLQDWAQWIVYYIGFTQYSFQRKTGKAGLNPVNGGVAELFRRVPTSLLACFFLSTTIDHPHHPWSLLFSDILLFCPQILSLMKVTQSIKCWADFWVQYIRSGQMCQPPWLNANRTSHLPKIGPPMSNLPGNGHFLRTSQQFHRKRKWERHHFHLRIPFVIPTRNSVSEDWKLRLIKEQVCQPVMINHKSICVSGWIHHW